MIEDDPDDVELQSAIYAALVFAGYTYSATLYSNPSYTKFYETYSASTVQSVKISIVRQ